MPKRKDLKKILVVGAGPIIIGQACEFDYSGTQAIRALKEEGYRVVLVNSNPATIMTDPDLADATYIEPLTREYLELVIKKEKPDAILPTVGGQTGLNLALELHTTGFLQANKVHLIGAQADAIEKAEDREKFKIEMDKVGIDTAATRSSATRSRVDRTPRRIAAKRGCPGRISQKPTVRPASKAGGAVGAEAGRTKRRRWRRGHYSRRPGKH